MYYALLKIIMAKLIFVIILFNFLNVLQIFSQDFYHIQTVNTVKRDAFKMAIDCSLIDNDGNFSLDMNVINIPIKFGYKDKNGNTQNLVSKLSLYSDAISLLVVAAMELTYDNKKNDKFEWYSVPIAIVGLPLLLDRILTNSKFNYYLLKPKREDGKFSYFLSTNFGIGSALFEGDNINSIYQLSPALGLRLGVEKNKSLGSFMHHIEYRSGSEISTGSTFKERFATSGLILDLGICRDFEFQKGSRPKGFNNLYVNIGFSTSGLRGVF